MVSGDSLLISAPQPFPVDSPGSLTLPWSSADLSHCYLPYSSS